MALLADSVLPPLLGFLAFLREELAPRPGRLGSVSRITGSCVLVVVIAMVYRIPDPALMLYLVFVLTHDEAASTLLAGVVAIVGATIAAMLSLAFFMIDASEPALRLSLMAGSTLLGMFLLRTMALGPIAFLATVLLVLSQTIIDKNPTMEALTRSLLWLWVIIAIPVTVTVLVDLVAGERPAQVAHRTALRLLRGLATALRSGDSRPLRGELAEAVGLVALRRSAGMLDQTLRGRTSIDAMLIETLAELLTLHRLLPADMPFEVRLPLAEACDASAGALDLDDASMMRVAPLPADAVLANLSPQVRPIVVAMATALTRLCDGIAGRTAESEMPAVPAAKSMFVADAFSNPSHRRFAFKTTVAVMAAYITYSLLDWPGISTAVTTCLIVAQSSLGETMSKLTLRIAGALTGGLIGGLCIVFLLPEMENIGQLCLLIAAVTAVSGWIATSSYRLSYAGQQMAFAFFLGVLQDYGPSTDLTVLRDRVVGILLGNLLMSVVFSTLWPTTATDRALASVASTFRALGQLLSDPASAKAGARLAVIRALGEARRFVGIAAFEQRMLPTLRMQPDEFGVSLESLDLLASATFTVVELTPDADIAEVTRRQDAAASAWFIGCADRLALGDMALVAIGASAEFGTAGTSLSKYATMSSRAAIEARALLQAEVANAVAVARLV